MVSHSNNDVSNALLRHYSKANSTVDTTRSCRHVMFLKIFIKKKNKKKCICVKVYMCFLFLLVFFGI